MYLASKKNVKAAMAPVTNDERDGVVLFNNVKTDMTSLEWSKYY